MKDLVIIPIVTVGAALIAVIYASAAIAIAQETKIDTEMRVDVVRQPSGDANLITGSIMRESEILNYCINVSDIAVEARSAVLKMQIEKIEKRVDKKLVIISAKIQELKKWSAKRDKFLKRTNKSLVQIFQVMRPDAAALQLTEIGPIMAAAVIIRLEPKTSSAILTEMNPTDAAKISNILASAIETDDQKPLQN